MVPRCTATQAHVQAPLQVVDAAISESMFNMLEGCVAEAAVHGFVRPPSGSTITGGCHMGRPDVLRSGIPFGIVGFWCGPRGGGGLGVGGGAAPYLGARHASANTDFGGRRWFKKKHLFLAD